MDNYGQTASNYPRRKTLNNFEFLIYFLLSFSFTFQLHTNTLCSNCVCAFEMNHDPKTKYYYSKSCAKEYFLVFLFCFFLFSVFSNVCSLLVIPWILFFFLLIYYFPSVYFAIFLFFLYGLPSEKTAGKIPSSNVFFRFNNKLNSYLTIVRRRSRKKYE